MYCTIVFLPNQCSRISQRLTNLFVTGNNILHFSLSPSASQKETYEFS